MTRRFVRFRRTYLRQISDKSAGLRLVKKWHTHVLTDRKSDWIITASTRVEPAGRLRTVNFLLLIKVAQIATRQKHIRYLEIASRQKLY